MDRNPDKFPFWQNARDPDAGVGRAGAAVSLSALVPVSAAAVVPAAAEVSAAAAVSAPTNAASPALGLGISRAGRVGVDRWFYFGVGVAFAAVAFIGFIPSYFVRIGNHTFNLPAIFHIHAVLLFSWTLLNAAQAWFVATGRVHNHRNWGLLGISLATAVAISIVLLVVTGIKMSDAQGMGIPARRFACLNISGVAKFAIFFAAAIVCVRRRELHKRLIVIANCILMGAPLGRLVVMVLVPPALRVGPPPAAAILLLLFLEYVPVFAGMILDWRTRGRPHPVYLAGLVSLATGLLVPVVSKTEQWMTVINHIVAFMG
jgi:hypothetical protein